MALSQQLLEKLSCPNCGNYPLEYSESENRLTCGKCRLAYRVSEDVPVLLVDEAERME
jgi:uncharacterized protein YbaR (Trm112 family)